MKQKNAEFIQARIYRLHQSTSLITSGEPNGKWYWGTDEDDIIDTLKISLNIFIDNRGDYSITNTEIVLFCKDEIERLSDRHPNYNLLTQSNHAMALYKYILKELGEKVIHDYDIYDFTVFETMTELNNLLNGAKKFLALDNPLYKGIPS